MPWTTVPTFVAGAVLTAAQLNVMGDDLDFIGGAWTAYTPAWTSTGTAPAIGNGTLAGSYKLVGDKTCHFRASITFGTTTTFGTGGYLLSLPFTSVTSSPINTTPVGQALQTNRYLINGLIPSASGTCTLYYVSVGTTGQMANVTNTAPVTWTATSGNYISIAGTFEVA